MDASLKARVDQIFAEWDRPDSPGCALLIQKDGEVVYKRGYGCAQLEYGIPITPSTVFHVASVSKQFTAMCILLLAQEGKIDLDDPVQKHLPDVPDLGEKVTIRHLVHHVSGVRDQWELVRMAGWRMDDVITREHVMKMMVRQRELNFPPGSEHLYSNMGYSLMAEVVARVSGMSFRDFAAKRIFEPLGMTGTHVHDDHEEIVKSRAYSYKPAGGGFKNSVLSYKNHGATSLFTTVEDLGKWLHNFDSHVVGGAKAIALMQKPYTLTTGAICDYGFALRLTEHRGVKMVGHSGADAGFRAWCGRFPEHGLGIVILANLSTMTPELYAKSVAEVLLGDAMEPVQPAPARPGVALSAITGTYLIRQAGLVVEFEQDGGRLYLKTLDGERQIMQHVEGSRFTSPLFRSGIEFVAGADGRVDRFDASSFGAGAMGQRVSGPSLDAAQLAEYAGKYYSPELDTTYTLVVENLRLVIKHQRISDFALMPAGTDAFVGLVAGAPELEFTLDGRFITGFRLSVFRVRNLWFKRV